MSKNCNKGNCWWCLYQSLCIASQSICSDNSSYIYWRSILSLWIWNPYFALLVLMHSWNHYMPSSPSLIDPSTAKLDNRLWRQGKYNFNQLNWHTYWVSHSDYLNVTPKSPGATRGWGKDNRSFIVCNDLYVRTLSMI
jgi:hypothetical protein